VGSCGAASGTVLRGVAINRLGSRFGPTGSDRKRDRSTHGILSKYLVTHLLRASAPFLATKRAPRRRPRAEAPAPAVSGSSRLLAFALLLIQSHILLELKSHRKCILSIGIYSSTKSDPVPFDSGQHSQYFFSTSCTVNPSVSRYSPIAARFDFRTCNDTYDALYTSAIAFSVDTVRKVDRGVLREGTYGTST